MANITGTSNIFDNISKLDSLRQERLFLKHKYKKLSFDWKFFKTNFPWVDTAWLEEEWSLNVFDLFLLVGKNESLFKQILTKKYLLSNFIKNKDGKISYDELITNYKLKKLNSKIEPIVNSIHLNNSLVIADVIKYYKIEAQIWEKENNNEMINGENVQVGKISKYFVSKVVEALLKSKRWEKSWKELVYKWWEMDKDLLEALGLNEFDFVWINPRIEMLAWQYDFFKKILKSANSWYVFTRRELVLITDVINDLRKWSVVMFTWDTWSGKTELARFLCNEFLGWEYVFVKWSRDLEVSDVTIEKSITSRSRLSTDKDIVDKEITDLEEFKTSEVVKVYHELIQSKEFKESVLKLAKDSSSDNNELQSLLDWLNLTEKKLITEYHLMWIYKAAKLGIPCIIDEVNIIRPEVFMALNDTLTRKNWDLIQLPNALWNIEVKKWFCIILTWNDPEQNTRTKKYTSWRYNFDEASYNRLRVYAKNYLNQIVQTHTENRDSDQSDIINEYLDENELYWVIMMMLFVDKKLNWDSEQLIKTWKYWFEVMKKDFEWNHIWKSDFLDSIKRFSQAISTVQKSFAWEVIPLSWKYVSKPLKDMIKRKVFSMRNLIEVLAAYRGDTLPLDYHIYNEFIRLTTNKEELYWLLIIFNQFWFFWDLVTDNEEASIKNVELKIWKLSKGKKVVDISDIENRFTITKQDLYVEYFWEMILEDSFFESSQEEIQNIGKHELWEEELAENIGVDYQNLEITWENIIDTIATITSLIAVKSKYFGKNGFVVIWGLSILFEVVGQSIINWRIDKDKYNILHWLLVKLHNAIDSLWWDNDSETMVVIDQIRASFDKALT